MDACVCEGWFGGCVGGMGVERFELVFFFFQAEDGIRDTSVTGVQTCALPICRIGGRRGASPIKKKMIGKTEKKLLNRSIVKNYSDRKSVV